MEKDTSFHRARKFSWVSSIRVRLALWYLLFLSILLIFFSSYIYSELSRRQHLQADRSLLRSAQAATGYFAELSERDNTETGAQATVREMELLGAGIAIYHDGKRLAVSNQEIAATVASERVLEHVEEGKPVFVDDMDGTSRLVAIPAQVMGGNYVIVVKEPMKALGEKLYGIRQMFYVGLPLTLALAALGAFLLAGMTLRPVVAISKQAAHISAQNLHERLQPTNPDDELGQLAGVINDLLSRLEKSFNIIRGFMADASHELRTPLAIIQGESEIALSQQRNAADYRQALESIGMQSRRTVQIVNDMFMLAKADAGWKPARVEQLYLNDLVASCCQAAGILACQKDIHLQYNDDCDDIPFSGDEELLRRMITNLLDNAVRYTPREGAITVTLVKEQDFARIRVADTGIGIPAEHLDRIFERFFRVNPSRGGDGCGLGLSIVKLAVDLHHGSIRVDSESGVGSTFTITLPLESADIPATVS